MDIYIYTYAYIYTYTYKYIHAYAHIYIYISPMRENVDTYVQSPAHAWAQIISPLKIRGSRRSQTSCIQYFFVLGFESTQLARRVFFLFFLSYLECSFSSVILFYFMFVRSFSLFLFLRWGWVFFKSRLQNDVRRFGRVLAGLFSQQILLNLIQRCSNQHDEIFMDETNMRRFESVFTNRITTS